MGAEPLELTCPVVLTRARFMAARPCDRCAAWIPPGLLVRVASTYTPGGPPLVAALCDPCAYALFPETIHA